MRETPAWTLPLGRWGEAPVRVHLFFPLAAACTLYLSWLAGQSGIDHSALLLAMSAVAALVISSILHVAGHAYAAARLGVALDPIVIGPLGDLASSSRVADPQSQLTISLAGPAVNLLVALACLPGVIASGQGDWLALLNPLAPAGLLAGEFWLVVLKLTLWINWTMALVNLLPSRPLDGGPCAMSIAFLLYPRASRRRIEMFVNRLGLFTGLALLVAAILWRESAAAIMPPWFPLLALGLLALFTSQRKAKRAAAFGPHDDDLFGYDFSQGYTSLERSQDVQREEEEPDGPLERWLQTRREARREQQQQLEAEEDLRVDEILMRVHEHGLQDLTAEERVLLERVSMRYRTRADGP